jgi:hypothetical protein
LVQLFNKGVWSDAQCLYLVAVKQTPLIGEVVKRVIQRSNFLHYLLFFYSFLVISGEKIMRSDKEAIQFAASILGFDRRPKEYIEWVDKNLQQEVSNSSITKTLGPYRQRENRSVDASLLLKANDFLAACNGNLFYSKSLLDRCDTDLKSGRYSYV